MRWLLSNEITWKIKRLFGPVVDNEGFKKLIAGNQITPQVGWVSKKERDLRDIEIDKIECILFDVVSNEILRCKALSVYEIIN